MESFAGKIAVVTGGGSGMGRELVRQLAAEGCSVATCDVHSGPVEQTAALARAGAPDGTTVTSHVCDVAEEPQVRRFRDEVLAAHAADHLDLVFSNAGIGGGGSFINDPREQWERVFAVDFWGVYYCARAFLPLLISSTEACWSIPAASTASGPHWARTCRTPRTPRPSSRSRDCPRRSSRTCGCTPRTYRWRWSCRGTS